MPWLTAGMTLVPSARPTSTLPCPTSVMRSGSILFWNVDVEAGLRVVARLVGQVERRELDARDEAEADGQRGRLRLGSALGVALGDGRRRRRG